MAARKEERHERGESKVGGGGEGGIEERNQRRLSAYEVGIVGRRRFARSLRIARRWASSLPAVQKRSDTEADVFSKWRRIRADK